MKATITRAIVATVAGLAIVGDAFLLFVKPHLSQSAATGGANGSALASGNGSGTGNPNGTSGSAGSGNDSNSGQPSNSDGNSGDDSTGSSSSDSTGSSSATGLKDGTYTSVASPNAYGNIQLQVTVKDGKITTITTVQAPNHGRSQSVNAQALPELTNRAISAQSADIQFVSGATETSTAFVNSLQDAINQSLNAGK